MRQSHCSLPSRVVFAGTLLAGLCLAGQARATESGASLYLLGSGGPATAVMPPVEGIYLDKLVWVYDGDIRASQPLPINGNVVAGVDMTVVADFTTLLAVPTTNFLGGTLSLGVTLPFGAPMLDAGLVVTGPLGNETGIYGHDSALTTGDPVGVGMLGWSADKLHVQVATMVNVPVGNYRESGLANLSLHRWAVDGSLALSWHDPESGWDISAKGGYTWNGRNDDTGYDSGDEIHFEGAIEKSLSPRFSLGVQTYYARQISDDGGALGPFRGETFAIGGTAATNVVMAGTPATFRFRYMHELDVTNRLKGSSFWIDFAIPLAMNLPAQ